MSWTPSPFFLGLVVVLPLSAVRGPFAWAFLPTSSPTFSSRIKATSFRLQQAALISRPSSIIFINDNNDGDDEEAEENDDDDDELDPYTKVADSEFSEKTNALSTMSASAIDWGGELGKLRQRMGDIESGKSQDPSNALFRLMSAKTPNQLIGNFVSSADPKVVTAMSGAVSSLLGGLSSPAMGVETIVKTNGEKIGSLCFQLQMTGYLFRNAEYILALKKIMNLRGGATMHEYKDAFDRLDTDGSGYIEAREVKRLLDSVYDGKAPSFEVDAFLNFFDTDNDGKISWTEFERGLGSALAQKAESNNPLSRLFADDDDDDDDHDITVEPDVSGEFPLPVFVVESTSAAGSPVDLANSVSEGEIEIELDSGKIVKVEARNYIKNLKSEAEALKNALAREKGKGRPGQNKMLPGAPPPAADDFGGIAQYIASRQGDVKALTEGIQPEVVETMKMLVDFVLEGGEGASRKKKPKKEEMEMELPGSALQQLALWQLVLGYRLRELEATGEYMKLLE